MARRRKRPPQASTSAVEPPSASSDTSDEPALSQSRWRRAWRGVSRAAIIFFVVYGGVAFMAKAVPEWEDFYTNRINPLITIEAETNQAQPFSTEFFLKNDGSFRLYNVEVITEFVRADRTDNLVLMSEGKVAFPDIYHRIGDISGKGRSVIHIPHHLRNMMEGIKHVQDTPSESWKRIALCHRVIFEVFPLNLLPIAPLRQDIGSFFDKEAGIHNWRQRPCEELKKVLIRNYASSP
jgi:hypothetical protein